jgi:23S rRNA A1618 N6-methylase RlmF
MFNKAEITQMTRQRDENGIIKRLINRVVIEDSEFGNNYTEIICEGEELTPILEATTQEEQNVKFQEWITPKIKSIYDTWIEGKQKEKTDTLNSSDIESKFGSPPIITSI